MSNKLTLINSLQGSVLDDRFSNISVANCDPITGEQLGDGGCLSVVFKADDELTGNQVAIKFFDPDFEDLDGTRKHGFLRESELLTKLNNVDRCVHIVQEIKKFVLSITAASGDTLSIELIYIVIEWLEFDILEYFLNQHQIEAITKLQIFRQCVLSVLSLHSARICHRDLKRDNFRIAQRLNENVVVSIDLGSAVSIDAQSNSNQLIYSNPRGASGFAPIESLCGLSGIRVLGVYSDIYALGAMLHDMFNVDYLFERLAQDSVYKTILGVGLTKMIVARHRNIQEKAMLEEWHKLIKNVNHQIYPLSIQGAGNSIPNSIKLNMEFLFKELTCLDYRKRVLDSNLLLKKIDAMIKILSAAKLERVKNDQRLKLKQMKEIKARELQYKLDQYLIKRVN